MKKYFSLVLALVMALSLTTVAWGAFVDPCTGTCTHEAAIGTTHYDTLAEAVAVGGTVTLLSDVTLAAPITVAAGNTVVLDLNGHTISGTDTTSANYGLININPGATLTINDSVGTGTITLSATTNSGWNRYSSVISNQRGTLIVNGGTIEHKGGTDMSYAIDNLTNTGAEPAKTTINGGVIKSAYIGIRQFCNSTTGNNALEINGGTIEGAKRSVWMQNPNDKVNDATLTITDGTFVGAVTVGIDDFDVAISGGTFDTDVSAYVVDGKQLLANGTVVTTPAAGATDPVLYVWDNAAKDWSTYYIATGDDLDDLKQGADESCLPCFLIDGEYFVETTKASATYKLVYGAKTVYLTPVDSSDVCYIAKASVLKVVETADAECGDFHTAVVGLKDVFYASYNPKTGAPNGFYKADKTSDINVLVDGKLVAVEVVTGAVEQLMHDFKGYDVVNYQYTTVKCDECGKVAKLYANAEAAGKKAQLVGNGVPGYITFADYMDFGANAPVVTDKVESAETFDAGIAMYVGMSVMAAAGSAVVIGKKRED